MTLDQIRYFNMVATFEHVGRAAIAASISPSVISATISNLEEELQCELFRKVGRRIELTDFGKKLHRKLQAVISDVDGIKTELHGEPQTLRAHLRLGASHYLASRMLLSGWSALQRTHRDLVADIYSMNTAHALAEVVSGRIDLAVGFSFIKHSSLKEFRLTEGEMLVAVRKGHPILRKSAAERFRFLRDGRAVIHKSTQGVESCESHPIFEAMGFQPKIEMFYDSDDTAVRRIQNSESWAFLPDLVTDEHSKTLEVIDIPRRFGKAQYSISAVVRNERASERAVRGLIVCLGGRVS
jgi:DNA-binding transcriptional LysR family regulator